MPNMLYRVTIQTADDYSAESCWLLLKPYMIPKYGADVEDDDDRSYRVLFHSSLLPSEMKKNLAEALRIYPGILWVDVLYRFPEEMYHDRFTVFPDSTAQEYTAYVTYVEDGERIKV